MLPRITDPVCSLRWRLSCAFAGEWPPEQAVAFAAFLVALLWVQRASGVS